MPGYYISDLGMKNDHIVLLLTYYIIEIIGDMLRTYICTVNEEESNFHRINIKIDYFEAVIEGYISVVGHLLTETEKQFIVYSGKFCIYMQV